MHLSAHPPFPAAVSVPFPVLAGVGEVVRHPGWVAALDAVRAGLAAGSPVVLAGDPGLGKSLLLLTLKRELEGAGQVVVLLPKGDPGTPARPPDVVLLDEADRVPPALVQDLLRRAPRCVLAGPRQLLGVVAACNIQPVLVEMRPLSPDEVGPYLQAQVERAGLPDALFGPGTYATLAAHSHGNPRDLQKLASRALFRTWMDDADEVSVAHVAASLAPEVGDANAFGSNEPAYEAQAFAPTPAPTPTTVFPQTGPEAPGISMASLVRAAPEQQPVAPSVPSVQDGTAHTSSRAWRRRVLVLGGVAGCLALATALVLRDDQPTAAAVPMPPPQAVVQDGSMQAGNGQAATASIAAERHPGEPPATPAPRPQVPAGQQTAQVPAGQQTEGTAEIAAPASKPVQDDMADVRSAPSPQGAPAEPRSQAAPTAAPSEAAAPAITPASTATAVAAPHDNGEAAPGAAPASQPALTVPGQQFAALSMPPVVPPPLPRPAATPMHVVVAFARTDAAAESRGASLVQALQKAGVDVVLSPGAPVGKDVTVNYFYSNDQAAAIRVARQAGAAGREQLAAVRGTPPRPGTVEVLFPSERAPGHGTP